MYPVSEAFLQAVQENTREYRWTGRITTVKGRVYEFGPEDIVKGSGYITRSCCGSSEIELGSVYASEMKVTLFLDVDRYSLEGASTELFYSLKLPDGSWETIPMGIFEISEANRRIRTLELTGYDYMLRFEKKAAVDTTGGYPYDLLSYACGKCRVELGHTQAEIEAMPNGKVLLGIYPDGYLETYRDLIGFTAQVLGRVCQIGRDGRLYLVAYGSEPVVTLGAVHRYSSSFSDFMTRYTAVYSTNEADGTAEYYCLDPDDGLTMSLGINPLLQYGLQETRETMVRNILDALSAVRYVPFDSETIGNAALDPGDVVRFEGGQADAGSVSCITSITCRINGKQTLKGVGKNPLLSSAKSRTDKNIAGLMNQVEKGKFVICTYENSQEFTVSEDGARVIGMVFAAVEDAGVLFMGNVCCRMDATEGENPVVSFRYRINDTWVEDYVPRQRAWEGENIFSLLCPLGSFSAGTAGHVEVYMSVAGGTATVPVKYCKAAVTGCGITAGEEWDGRIVAEDAVGVFALEPSGMELVAFSGDVSVSTERKNSWDFGDSVKRMKLQGNMELAGLKDETGVS